VLCKHEVVGSIPSGSTTFSGLEAASAASPEGRVSEPAIWKLSLPQLGCCEDRQVPQGRLFGEDISDIVKRECGRWRRESAPADGHVRQAYGGGSGNGSATGLFVTVSLPVIRILRLPVGGHRSRERSSALRAFGGCLGAERR
jgi:hypothetical protein